MIISTGAYSHPFCEWSILWWKVMKTWMKHISCVQKGQTTSHAKNQSKNLASHQLICGQVKLKSRCFLHFGVCCACFQRIAILGKPVSTACDIFWIAHGNFIIVGRSMSTKRTVATKHGKVAPSIATRVLFDIDGHGKSVFLIFVS